MNLTPTTAEERDFESACVRGYLPPEFTEMAMGSDAQQIRAKVAADIANPRASGADRFAAMMHTFFFTKPAESV